jgi:acyl-homoserine lactone synthase
MTRRSFIALEEFALSRDITNITTVSETNQIDRLARVDLHFETLGPPVSYENGKGEAQALLLDVSPHALARTRAATGIYERQLFEVKPRPIYSNVEDFKNEAEEELALAQSRLAGRNSTKGIVRALADEIVRRVEDNPAAAISLIHEFNTQLSERLTQESAKAYSNAQRPDTADTAMSANDETNTKRRTA